MKFPVTIFAFLLILPHCSIAQIIDIPDSLFKSYLLANNLINLNGDTEIQVTEALSTKSIICSDLGIASLTGVEHFINLDTLICNNNKIKNLNLENNPNLIDLRCEGNELDSIDLSKNIRLFRFYASDNNLNHLNFGPITGIEQLIVENNNLQSLDIGLLKDLRRLGCNNNKLTELNIENAQRLFLLWCDNNNISAINTSNCPVLRSFHIDNNNLTSLDLSANVILDRLVCSSNNIDSLDLSQNIELSSLKADYNKITKLNLTENKILRNLSLNNNLLFELSIDSLVELQSIHINDNKLTSIDIQNLPKLAVLNIASNKLMHANISNGNNENFLRMDIDSNFNLYCINVDQGLNIDSISNEWMKDDQAQYNVDCCSLLDFEIEENICEGEIYTSPSGSTITSSDGIIMDTIHNEVGCDSTFEINLVVTTINNEISQNLDTLLSSIQSDAYQWVDCSTGEPLDGETNSYFTPQSSGEYAVEVIQEGCVDISECYQITLTSSLNITQNSISIYPNPTNSLFYIRNLENTKPIDVTITNSIGQVVKRLYNQTSATIPVKLFENGLYHISIRSNNNIIENSIIVKH